MSTKDIKVSKETKNVFDHEGKSYPSVENMCRTYNVYPEHYFNELENGKTKKEALTGKKETKELLKRIVSIICVVLSIILIIIILHRVVVSLPSNFFDGLAKPTETSVVDSGNTQANMGFEKLHVDYSNLVTIKDSKSASCSIENTSSEDIRFSIECNLDTQQGNSLPFAKNETVLKPGDKITSLEIIEGATIPTSKVTATFVLTLYEGDSSTPLSHKVDIHSIIVAPN